MTFTPTGGKTRFKNIIAALFFLGFLIPSPAAPAQETDPFYRKWLETGEASYFARAYERAVEDLEIAVFGLARDANLRARGYVFLALSRTALGLKERATENLASAAGLVGWDALRTMPLQGEARARLDALLSGIPRETAPPSPPPVAEKESPEIIPVPVEPLPSPDPSTAPDSPAAESSAEELRRALAADPRNPEICFELARRLRQSGDFKSARAALEDFLEENPAEIRTRLEIGRLEYLAGDPKAALKTLEKFLALTENVPVEDRFRDEGRALFLLSADRKGDRKLVARRLKDWADLFLPERLGRLTLDPADVERLQGLR